MSVSLALGRFVAGTSGAELPEQVLHDAARALIEWSGSLVAGWSLPVMAPLLTAVADELGSGPARVFGPLPSRASARPAALLNGTASARSPAARWTGRRQSPPSAGPGSWRG